MVKVGEWVIVRDWRTLFNNVKTANARNWLTWTIEREVGIDNSLIYIEIVRINKKSWQITQVVTEDNSFDMENDKLILDASVYDTKKLLNAKKITYYNELFGECEEYNIGDDYYG